MNDWGNKKDKVCRDSQIDCENAFIGLFRLLLENDLPRKHESSEHYKHKKDNNETHE